MAWFTMQAGQGRAYIAFSSDAGRTFGAPVRVDDAGSTGRVQVELLADGSAAVSWIEFGKGPSQLKVRTVSAERDTVAAGRHRPGLGTQFPRMAAAKGELVFAWTENSRGITRIYTARAKLSVTMNMLRWYVARGRLAVSACGGRQRAAAVQADCRYRRC